MQKAKRIWKTKIKKEIAMTKSLSHLGWLLVILICPVSAQEEIVKVQTFEPPQPYKRFAPEYPYMPLRKGQEGWVDISMMIDEKGKPYEVTVVDSAGDNDFENSALKAVRSWTYKPAKSGDTPITSSARIILGFEIKQSQNKIDQEFVGAYKVFSEGLSSKSPEELKKALDAVLQSGGEDRLELAYQGLAKYLYSRRYGSEQEQMANLREALSFSRRKGDPVYLPDTEAKFARRELMKLQVKNKYFREALYTYSYFEAIGDGEAVNLFKSAYDQILALENGADGYELPLELNVNGAAYIELLKRKVYISEVDGEVSEMKVRCEKKYFGLSVEADIGYDIPKEWGACSAEFLGRVGTKFILGQQ
jgi:TonB family protein